MGVAESSNVAGNRYKNAGNRTFNGMAEDTAAANRASNGGNRLATHTTGAVPRPASQGGGSGRHGAPRAVGAEVNPPIAPRALFARDWRDRNGLSLVWGLGVSTPRPAKLAGLGVRPHPS